MLSGIRSATSLDSSKKHLKTHLFLPVLDLTDLATSSVLRALYFSFYLLILLYLFIYCILYLSEWQGGGSGGQPYGRKAAERSEWQGGGSGGQPFGRPFSAQNIDDALGLSSYWARPYVSFWWTLMWWWSLGVHQDPAYNLRSWRGSWLCLSGIYFLLPCCSPVLSPGHTVYDGVCVKLIQ